MCETCSFGNRLVGLLNDNGYTRNDLIRKTGISAASLSHYINGRRIPRPEQMKKIARALHTTTQYLAGVRNSAEPNADYLTLINIAERNADILTTEEKLRVVNALNLHYTCDDLCYSYAMGIGEEVYSLIGYGFHIEDFADGFGVTFPEELASKWERFISAFMTNGYWNEYICQDKCVFIFMQSSIPKRYYVENYNSTEVLELCKSFSGNSHIDSLRNMIMSNEFYRSKLI